MSTINRDPQPTVQPDRGDPDDGSESLSREDIFDVLSNRRRRYALHYLKQLDDGETAELAELSSQIAAWENEVDVAEVTYDDRKSVQTSMYQFHLPKLEAKNVIDYDKRAGEIKCTGAVDTIDLYLEAVSETEISWSLYFLLLSVGAAGLAVAVWTDSILFDALSARVWLAVTAATFLVTSVIYAYHHRYKMRFGTSGPPPEAEP